MKTVCALACAAACCITSCESSRDVSGVIESVGSGSQGGSNGVGTLRGTEYRYVKLVNDPHMYICGIDRVPACARLVKGQKIDATVDNDGYIYTLVTGRQ